jgi:hypothetical protein
MYSWAQRPDTVVVDEPLYGYYLSHSNATHPGKAEIIASMEYDAEKVLRNVLLGEYPKPVVFFKHMCHHMLDLDLSFMKDLVNLFFIRDPAKIIASYAEVIKKPTLTDIGIEIQSKQFEYALKNGYETIVLDSAELLNDPETVLTKLCSRIGIPFYREMLQWPAGPRPEDGVWAKYWYAQVHQSTGFQISGNNAMVIPEPLKPLYEQAEDYYASMKSFSIKA